MRKIRHVLRLAHEGASLRSIAAGIGVTRSTVVDYVTRAKAAGLSWPLPADLDDTKLEARLFPRERTQSSRRPQPDCAALHQALKEKGATLEVLHAEYLAAHPEGLCYSQFCHIYRAWQRTVRPYLRQSYKAGERVFVDYSGKTFTLYDPVTNEPRTAQIFVGVLGASVYTYAEAHWTQGLPDWLAAHVRMFEYFEGVPEIVVCDNLKAGVTRASKTEPKVNDAYQHLAEHFGTMILPARPYEPTDKARAEHGVKLVQRWVLFCLRKQRFTSLEAFNTAILKLLEGLNAKPFQKLPGSRRSVFEAIDRPALKPLPVQRYEYTEFRKVRVGLDGRFEHGSCRYSAPAELCRQEIELRVTTATIELLHRGRRVASHERSHGTEPVIDPQHLLPAHRHFGQWSAEAEVAWAEGIGPHAKAFLQLLLSRYCIKEQGYRTANAMRTLVKRFGAERLEAACARALNIGGTTLTSVRSILNTGLDQQPHQAEDANEADFDHPNVRGPRYYH